MKETGKKIWKLNASVLKVEALIEKWKKIARTLTDANETLEEKLQQEKSITDHRRREILGKDALKQWYRLLKIVKATSIEECKKREAERRLERK